MRLGHKRPDHLQHQSDSDTHDDSAGVETAPAGSLDAWIVKLAGALRVDATAIERDQVLELSRSTHRVARAAAPFTLLLTDIAAGLNGGGAGALTQAIATAQRLASEHDSQSADEVTA
jgi:hypothetical protein